MQKSGSGTQSPPALTTKSPTWYDSLKGIELGPGTLDIGLNLRSRYEFTDNFNVRTYGNVGEDNLLLLRTRLSLDYHLGKPAHIYVELQDARYWFSDLKKSDFAINHPHYDEWDLRQAFVEWEKIGGSPLGFKVGRQTITYADRRVFGPGEWGNVGRYWWDAAKLYWHADLVKVEFLYGRRVVSEPFSFNDQHFPYHMGAVYAQFRQFSNSTATVKPDLFYIGRYDTHGNLRDELGRLGDQVQHTVGGHLEGKIRKNWDYHSTVALQFGEYGQSSINAYGFVIGGGYNFDTAWSPRLGGEFCYASGDHDPHDGKRGTFDNVYGAIDAYVYGWMNVVSWMNLEDYMFTFSVRPAKNLKLWIEYNYYRLAEAKDAWYYGTGRALRRDTTGQAGRELGHEINLLGEWKATKELDVLAGYGCFIPGEFVKNTPGDDDPAHWVFAQITFNF